MLSIHKYLWHQNLLTPHPIPDLVLVLGAHEDVSLLVLHQEVPQDLLHENTALVRAPHDAHCGGVDYNLAGIFFFIALWKEIVN